MSTSVRFYFTLKLLSMLSEEDRSLPLSLSGLALSREFTDNTKSSSKDLFKLGLKSSAKALIEGGIGVY